MDSYTVISGTNRLGSNTRLFAQLYYSILIDRGVEVKLLDLGTIEMDFLSAEMYDRTAPGLQQILEKYFINASKIIILMPEYNGSFPGILKLFLDAINPAYIKNKKFALVGIANGRSGNMRGLDNLTNILHYLDAEVLPFKLPVSRIETLMDNGKIINRDVISLFENQASRLIDY